MSRGNKQPGRQERDQLREQGVEFDTGDETSAETRLLLGESLSLSYNNSPTLRLPVNQNMLLPWQQTMELMISTDNQLVGRATKKPGVNYSIIYHRLSSLQVE